MWKKGREPEGRRRMRGMKNWGQRRRAGCHHQSGWCRWCVCAAGQPNGLWWDMSVKEVRKKSGIFPGRISPHMHAHTNATNSHTPLTSHLSPCPPSWFYLLISHPSSYSSQCLPLRALHVLLSFLSPIPPFLLFPPCLASSLFPLSFPSSSPTILSPFLPQYSLTPPRL